MKNRLKLQNLLEKTLGSRNVYFQPPTGLQIKYPCIVYTLNNLKNTYANNGVYKQDDCYSITVIDEDPESEVVNKLSLFPKCSFNNNFVSEGLYHTVFTIYF